MKYLNFLAYFDIIHSINHNNSNSNMKFKTLIIAVILVAIAGVFLVINRSMAPTSDNIKNNHVIVDETVTADEKNLTEQNLPWVEVLSSLVSKKTGEEWLELISGDQLKNGDIVKTDSSGLANIYLPDGSVIRLDSDSQILISEADYEVDSKTLKLKIKLIAGRVWSKIFELATNESYWEVETANAVAAVRGTAFGVEYENDETVVIGWENTVEVEAVDIYSGRKLGIATVSANKILRINETIARMSAGERDVLSSLVEDLPLDVQNLEWVKRSINADAGLFEADNLREDLTVEQIEPEEDSINLLDVSAPIINQRK